MNIEHLLDVDHPESMNFCPVCDDPVHIHEQHMVVEAWGVKTLAHTACVEGHELG